MVCDFDVNGSLAESHDGHGTDMGFVSGIIGLPVTDPSVADYLSLAEKAGVETVGKRLIWARSRKWP